MGTFNEVLAGTERGRIEWHAHDSGQGYWAVRGMVYRFDLVDGHYRVVKNGVVLDEAEDECGVLLAAVEAYLERMKADEVARLISDLGADDGSGVEDPAG